MFWVSKQLQAVVAVENRVGGDYLRKLKVIWFAKNSSTIVFILATDHFILKFRQFDYCSNPEIISFNISDAASDIIVPGPKTAATSASNKN